MRALQIYILCGISQLPTKQCTYTCIVDMISHSILLYITQTRIRRARLLHLGYVDCTMCIQSRETRIYTMGTTSDNTLVQISFIYLCFIVYLPIA